MKSIKAATLMRILGDTSKKPLTKMQKKLLRKPKTRMQIHKENNKWVK